MKYDLECLLRCYYRLFSHLVKQCSDHLNSKKYEGDKLINTNVITVTLKVSYFSKQTNNTSNRPIFICYLVLFKSILKKTDCESKSPTKLGLLSLYQIPKQRILYVPPNHKKSYENSKPF